MAVVHFVRKVPAADGVLVPARGGLRFTPTARRVIVGAPDVVVLPASFSVQLVNGAADVTLEPTTGAWVWRVDEYCTGTPARTTHVTVPAVAELDDTDLVIVDPATLAPAAVDNLAWVSTIGAVFHVSNTAPTETTRHGVPVVWIDTTATSDTAAPSAVTSLTAGTATTTTVPLSWTAATDNTAVTGYEYSLNGTTWTATGSTGTTYTVTGLTAGTAYTIQVRAYDAAGNKGTAASVNATTTAATDTTAPTAPTNLTGTAGTTTMDLSWTASTDAVGVTGYRVSKDNGATWITSAVTSTTYQITGLTASTSYTFAVAARDAAGNWSTNATLTQATTAATLTQVFLDTFTGANGAFTGHLADTGQSWAGSTANATIEGNRLNPSAAVTYSTYAGTATPQEGLADMTAPSAGSTIVSFRAPASTTLDGSIVNITSGGLVSFGGGSVSPATITFNNGRANATDNYTAIPGFVAGGTYAVKMTWSGSTVTVYIGGTRLLEGTYSAAQMTTLDTYRSVQVQADTGGFVDNLKVSV